MKIYDMLLANAMMGEGGGGGGGDSDISSVEVTIVGNPQYAYFNGKDLWNDKYVVGLVDINGYLLLEELATHISGASTTFQVVLIGDTDTNDNSPSIMTYAIEPTVSGSATKFNFEGDWMVFIHGDCTITISA